MDQQLRDRSWKGTIRRVMEVHITSVSTLQSISKGIHPRESWDTARNNTIHTKIALDALAVGKDGGIKETHSFLLCALKEHNILEDVKRIVKQREENEPVFKVTRTYVDMA